MGEVFDLYGKLLLDDEEFVKGLREATSTAEKGGGGIGAALGKAAKVAGAALAAATGAVVKFGALFFIKYSG